MQQNYFVNNLKKLANKFSQKQISADTGVSPASVNNYLKTTSEPSASFLLKLKKAYQINIDEFLTKDISFSESISVSKNKNSRFAGDYIIYYYDTNVYKGRVNYSTNILKYGVISIFNENGSNSDQLLSYALFVESRREAEDTLKTLTQLKNEVSKKAFYDMYELKYSGTFEERLQQVFLNLKNEKDNDYCSIILNNPPTLNKYIGGLGTVNSVAKGREKMPCIQFIIISKNAIRLPDGEIYSMLCLDMPEISLHNETDQVINLFKNLYMASESNPNQLNEYQKKRIVEDSLTNIISDIVEANMFRFAKVSNMEDDNYFRIIREVSEDDNEL